MKDNGIYHGSRVRVFDFAAGMYGRDLGGPMAFYVEGVVSAFDYDGLERVVVVVTKDVQAGKETNERLGKVVKPVNNGVEDQYGRTVNVIDIMPDDSEPIEECKPIELKNEILVLKYLPNTGFNESLFNRATPFVQEITFKHFGRKLKLDIIKEKKQINYTEELNSENDQNNLGDGVEVALLELYALHSS